MGLGASVRAYLQSKKTAWLDVDGAPPSVVNTQKTAVQTLYNADGQCVGTFSIDIFLLAMDGLMPLQVQESEIFSKYKKRTQDSRGTYYSSYLRRNHHALYVEFFDDNGVRKPLVEVAMALAVISADPSTPEGHLKTFTTINDLHQGRWDDGHALPYYVPKTKLHKYLGPQQAKDLGFVLGPQYEYNLNLLNKKPMTLHKALHFGLAWFSTCATISAMLTVPAAAPLTWLLTAAATGLVMQVVFDFRNFDIAEELNRLISWLKVPGQSWGERIQGNARFNIWGLPMALARGAAIGYLSVEAAKGVWAGLSSPMLMSFMGPLAGNSALLFAAQIAVAIPLVATTFVGSVILYRFMTNYLQTHPMFDIFDNTIQGLTPEMGEAIAEQNGLVHDDYVEPVYTRNNRGEDTFGASIGVDSRSAYQHDYERPEYHHEGSEQRNNYNRPDPVSFSAPRYQPRSSQSLSYGSDHDEPSEDHNNAGARSRSNPHC